MKKITALLLWLFVAHLTAQELENNALTATHETTLLLKPLLIKDQTLYKNSILYNQVAGLSRLNEFNTTPNATTHTAHFLRAWQELYDARLTTTNKHLPIQQVKEIVAHTQNKGTIPVGFINMDFTQFTPSIKNALTNGTVTVAQLASRTNRSSLYEHKHVFLASPLTSKTIVTASNTPVQFQLGMLGLNEAALKIKTLQASYNGSAISLVSNSNLVTPNFSFRFSSSGIKNMVFKATLTNGKQLTVTAKFKVTIQNVLARTPVTSIIATEPFKGYDEPANCNGTCYGKGEYKVFLSEINTKLKKPIIILDGFDPGDTRRINNGEGSIIEVVNNKGTEENMTKFSKAGFDVIILNFPKYVISDYTVGIYNIFNRRYYTHKVEVFRDGGSDYLERNANILKALITEVNQKLRQNGSTEKIKIIGPSMGGLISRIALTQMEKDNQNHNTDTWVSFDSPHLGANIPIGLQYAFTFLGVEAFTSLLRTPAARQMLLAQNPAPFTLSSISNEPAFIRKILTNEWHKYPGDYSFRNRLKNLLVALDFPKKTRNISIANGAINGKRQGTPKGKMLDLEAFALSGLLLDYDLTTFASHDGGKHKIFERKKSNFLIFRNTKSVYLKDLKRLGSLDNSPGGTFNMTEEFEDALGTKLPLNNFNAGNAVNTLLQVKDGPAKLGVKILTSLLLFHTFSSINLDLSQGTPTFIPTKSALAFKGSNRIWHENLSSRNLICNGETPFDTYYAPEVNEEHVTLDAKKMDWVLEELKGNKQFPVPLRGGSRIVNASKKLCVNTLNTATFSIATCSTPNVRTWSSSSNLRITRRTPTSISVQAINNGNRRASITAKLVTGETITKQITMFDAPKVTFTSGTALRDAILNGRTLANESPFYVKNKERIGINITNVPNKIQWKHTRSKANSNILLPYDSCFLDEEEISVRGLIPLVNYTFIEDVEQDVNPSKSLELSFENNTGYFETEVTIGNECGCSTETNIYKYIGSAPVTEKPLVDFTVYPNPVNSSDDSLRVKLFRNELTEDNEIIACNLTVTNIHTSLRVYNKSFTFINDEKTIYLIEEEEGLPSGIYTVNLNYNGKTVSKQLIIR